MLSSAAVIAACTLLTRLLGYCRDLALASRFGSSPVVDAYLQAYRLVDVTVYLLAAGGASATLVPALVRVREEHGPEAGWALLRRVLRMSLLVLLTLLVLEELAAPWLATLLGPGFAPATLDLTVRLMRWMLPAMTLLGLSAVGGAALNASGRFAIPALGWGLLDIGILTGALQATPDDCRPLAAGVLAGSAGSLALQYWGLHRAGFRLSGAARADTLQLGRSFVTVASVLLFAYLNLEVAAALASTAGEGWVMLLRYANRVVNVPLGLIGTALSVALLPNLSLALSQSDSGQYRQVWRRSVWTCAALCGPAALVLGLGSRPLVDFLFGHGRFTPLDCERLARLVQSLAVGLPAAALVQLHLQSLYAHGRFRLALLGMALPLGASILAFIGIMGNWQVYGLALVLGGAPWLQLALLSWLLRRSTVKLSAQI